LSLRGKVRAAVLDRPAVCGLFPTVVRSDAYISSPRHITTLDAEHHNAVGFRTSGHDVVARSGTTKTVVLSDGVEAVGLAYQGRLPVPKPSQDGLLPVAVAEAWRER